MGLGGVFLLAQPAQLSSRESPLVWLAVNEDGVSILDHSTMVWKGGLPLLPSRLEGSDQGSALPTLPKACRPLVWTQLIALQGRTPGGLCLPH